MQVVSPVNRISRSFLGGDPSKSYAQNTRQTRVKRQGSSPESYPCTIPNVSNSLTRFFGCTRDGFRLQDGFGSPCRPTDSKSSRSTDSRDRPGVMEQGGLAKALQRVDRTAGGVCRPKASGHSDVSPAVWGIPNFMAGNLVSTYSARLKAGCTWFLTSPRNSSGSSAASYLCGRVAHKRPSDPSRKERGASRSLGLLLCDDRRCFPLVPGETIGSRFACSQLWGMPALSATPGEP